MKFSIPSGTFYKTLSVLSKAVSRGVAEPILENFLFETPGDGKLTITATDKELTLRSTIEAEVSETTGPCCIPARILLELLKELPELPVELATAKDADNVTIEWFGGQSVIPVANANDYPSIPSADKESGQSVTFPSDILLGCIQKTLPATATDPIRPALEGIQFHIGKDGTETAASETHMMLLATTAEVRSDTPRSFLLHRKAASALKNFLRPGDDPVTVTYDASYIEFSYGDTQLICRTITQKFPNYKSVIPSGGSSLTVERKPLLDAIRRVYVFSSPATGQVTLNIAENTILVEGKDIGFGMNAKDSLGCSYDGLDMAITFKGQFLQDILSVLDADEVSVELTSPVKAALFRQDEKEEDKIRLLAVLMPVKS